mmetsp:Transcript_44515/g.105493  ORF Transcript_44515/g.105493 Transcript_44515/m.105493 type:complete len:253 (-) Transcript_44515:116-874(-)|eukprot:CAMPEP_0178414000 /NCGR_PEP_ID=MMETSP0689_2-20121128/22813_1 /TAXON_ID=160604 /ORGANISM="Amphidinium massartii, Strain CS-259" /LENGTH=252 /DNA_ID=CAMNT_0020035281 /DNA_START=92 /DNA_END=850 /DNA_ORIENTATION=-
MSGTREENVFMARLAEQAERYEDMVEYMKRVAMMGAELSLDERNLLSVAYKNSVGARRSAWRNVHSLEEKEAGKGPAVVELMRGYRAKVEQELNQKCSEILQILQTVLLPLPSATSEPKVFYLKMKGDYHRYQAEYAAGDVQSKCAQDAHDSYQEATSLATGPGGLPATHPIRLGLALNFSVFYYEVYGAPDKACALARAAFDEAVQSMGQLEEDQYKDSATILQLLRDNLTLWQSEGGKPPEQDGTAVEEM